MSHLVFPTALLRKLEVVGSLSESVVWPRACATPPQASPQWTWP